MSAPIKPPLTAAEVSGEWVSIVRGIVARDGYALRAAAGNMIEASPSHNGVWSPVMLPGGAMSFATQEDRDAVLAKLNGPTNCS